MFNDRVHSIEETRVALSRIKPVLRKNNFNATSNPTVTDDASKGYRDGSLWINQTANRVYILEDDATIGAASWILLAPEGGSAPLNAKFIVQESHPDLTNEQSLGLLTTGLLKNTVTAAVGVLSTAVPGTDYGDVAGPALSTNNSIVRWDGTTGKIIQNGATTGTDAPTIDDSGHLLMANNRQIRFRDTLCLISSISSGDMDIQSDDTLLLSTNGLQVQDTGNRIVLDVPRTALGVNYLRLTNSAAGTALPITAIGTDTDIDINAVPKGAGHLQENGVDVALTGTGINSAILKSIIDAEGDIITASAADTPIRLALGTLSYALRSNGTRPEYMSDAVDGDSGILPTYLTAPNRMYWRLDINALTADASPDGAADYVATYDASAGIHKKVLLDDLPGGGGGTPGGSDTQMQYNNGGAFGGTSGLTWDDAALALLFAAAQELQFRATTNKIHSPSADTLRLTSPALQLLGNVTVADNAGAHNVFIVADVALAVNYLRVRPNATGSAPMLEALGSDANVHVNVIPQGTGRLQENGANVLRETIVDAKGDLISATAADTPARLAVGTDGQVLTADSAEATGIKWATPSGGIPTQITVADTVDATCFVALFEDATGDLAPKTDAGITYDASTGNLVIGGTFVSTAVSLGNVAGKLRWDSDGATGIRALTTSNTLAPIRGLTLEATATTGTAPLIVASTTVVPNLNADMVDGKHVASATTTAEGLVELATTAETTTGTDATRAVTPDGLAGSIYGRRTYPVEVFGPTTTHTTGNGKKYFPIPADLGGMNLVAVHAMLVTAGTTGTLTVQIHNLTQAADMLSTAITIDSGETGSDTAATAAVIDTANDDVASYDRIRIDVDAVHTTPGAGLVLALTFETP